MGFTSSIWGTLMDPEHPSSEDMIPLSGIAVVKVWYADPYRSLRSSQGSGGQNYYQCNAKAFSCCSLIALQWWFNHRHCSTKQGRWHWIGRVSLNSLLLFRVKKEREREKIMQVSPKNVLDEAVKTISL